jgi:protein-L-isoaspartate(D-aspartate) O-methyltransferase
VEPGAARELGMALVDDPRAKDSVRSAAADAAMQAAPRHVFLPGAPLEQAHANDALVTKGALRMDGP